MKYLLRYPHAEDLGLCGEHSTATVLQERSYIRDARPRYRHGYARVAKHPTEHFSQALLRDRLPHLLR